jgi:hypothetical protein
MKTDSHGGWQARLLVVLAALFWLPTAVQAKAPATDTKTQKTDCVDCHERSEVLPAGHKAVKDTKIASCGGVCHKPQAGTQTPNPIVSQLHRQHVNDGVSCKSCHVLLPGDRFALVGAKTSLGTLSAEHYPLLQGAAKSWARGPNLAAAHGGQKNLSCGACHGQQLIPDDNETVVNASCVDCHGDFEKVAAQTRSKLRNPSVNPHSSHMGPEIACTVCHQGHTESRAYCVNCHTNFVMPMPEATARAQ